VKDKHFFPSEIEKEKELSHSSEIQIYLWSEELGEKFMIEDVMLFILVGNGKICCKCCGILG
jgi:hypothetical protein